MVFLRAPIAGRAMK